ncbi:hypothetical protein Lalb_Chr09g0328591 [Lupinus albus]|uniref:Uncharacterized protein n=1 Tax=Lupinus albus TaxID=3870 RepID=A0A6A4Q0F4_LUPAL|nr:hypothetical protein Lalb_Chr09g0328591 [Lupinus albus]
MFEKREAAKAVFFLTFCWGCFKPDFRLSWSCELNELSLSFSTFLVLILNCFLHQTFTTFNLQEFDALDIAEEGSNWWTKFEDRNIHVLRTDIAEKPARYPNMEKPCLIPITTASTSYVPTHTTHNTQVLAPPNYNLPVVLNMERLNYYDNDEENAYPRTLELFPLKSDDQDGISHSERKSRFYATNDANMDTDEITSNQFFEFLPLRN